MNEIERAIADTMVLMTLLGVLYLVVDWLIDRHRARAVRRANLRFMKRMENLSRQRQIKLGEESAR